jgi:hypothetical protein
MAKPYWFKQHGGFVHDGNRLHREELKTINAQLAGHWEAPVKLWPRRISVLPLVLPEQFVPVKAPEQLGLVEHIRDTRLDILQTLGELMLDADAA